MKTIPVSSEKWEVLPPYLTPAKGTAEDAESFAYWHGSPHKAIVLEWLGALEWYGLSREQRARIDRARAILESKTDEEIAELDLTE